MLAQVLTWVGGPNTRRPHKDGMFGNLIGEEVAPGQGLQGLIDLAHPEFVKVIGASGS